MFMDILNLRPGYAAEIKVLLKFSEKNNQFKSEDFQNISQQFLMAYACSYSAQEGFVFSFCNAFQTIF